jgi:hypothetical protein
MGDWRNNKDDEIQLDGIGGVNIMVKADVHRSGTRISLIRIVRRQSLNGYRHQLPMLRLRKPS